MLIPWLSLSNMIDIDCWLYGRQLILCTWKEEKIYWQNPFSLLSYSCLFTFTVHTTCNETHWNTTAENCIIFSCSKLPVSLLIFTSFLLGTNKIMNESVSACQCVGVKDLLCFSTYGLASTLPRHYSWKLRCMGEHRDCSADQDCTTKLEPQVRGSPGT